MKKEVDFEKMNGLVGVVPAIIQDDFDGAVLMLGFMNAEALERTLEQGLVTFWSRTKQRLWQKGETSGNHLEVVSVDLDCDSDTLLIRARPRGPVCHTGSRSCFPARRDEEAGRILNQLERIIADRKEKAPAGSYTAELFNAGPQKIGQKLGEEAVELAIAAQYPDVQRCVEEAADLVYHLMVLLAAKGITLQQVEAELANRMNARRVTSSGNLTEPIPEG
ncbi:MAG: bifunctional phosphoribosyl-AMP cyclohydrolase/phosphoribosyl-ATP diphosphatase HisIE [Acidobacteriota bacterium]